MMFLVFLLSSSAVLGKEINTPIEVSLYPVKFVNYKSRPTAVHNNTDTTAEIKLNNANESECKELAHLHNGTISPSGATRLGQSVTIKCNSGYILMGPKTLKCNRDGQWQPYEMVSCMPIECPTMFHFPNGQKDPYELHEPGTMTFTCNTGFKMRGPNMLDCTSNGTWVPNVMPFCESYLESKQQRSSLSKRSIWGTDSEEESEQVLVMTEDGAKFVTASKYLAMLRRQNKSKYSKKHKNKKRVRNIPSLKTGMCFVSGQFKPVRYDVRDFLCCEGLYPRNSSSDVCCDGQIINSDQEICCSDKVFKKSETNHSECCGKQLYDPNTHICCRQALYDRTESSACCSNMLYNSTSQLCCFSLYVHNRTDGDQCCGLHVYNSTTQTCCYGNIQKAYGKKNRRGECCREKSYDARCYMCNKNTYEILPLYNTTRKICCDGSLRKLKFANDTKCCGSRVYNASISSDSTCIDDRIVEGVIFITTIHLNRHDNNSSAVNATSKPDPSYTSQGPSRVVTYFICGLGIFAFLSAITLTLICVKRQRKKTKSAFLPSDHETTPLNNAGHSAVNRTYHDSVRSDNRSISVASKTSKHCSSLYLNMLLDMPEEHEEDDYMNNLNKKRLDEAYYTKDGNNKNVLNICDNLLVESGTQTCQTKLTNVMNIFGRPFHHTIMVDNRNPTIQMPESDEKMILPEDLLKSNVVETLCSTYWNLQELGDKFSLPEDETFASPVVEYKLIGYDHLSSHALVVKPFIGRAKDLKVYKFPSDQGASLTCEPKEVPTKENCTEDDDCFYVISDNYVYIFTKSFSGFLCTTCKHTRNLILTAFLYGSYKEIKTNSSNKKYEVRLKLYVADELFNFKDYQQDMKRQEELGRRSLQVERQLDLNDQVLENDELQMHLSLNTGPTGPWIPKMHPTKNIPMFADVQTVQLKKITVQCPDCPNRHQERRTPFSVEWYFENNVICEPSRTFQCVVDIVCVSQSDELQDVEESTTTTTTIIIDDLALPESNSQFLQDSEEWRFSEIQQYFQLMETVKQDRLQYELCQTHRIRGDCLASTCHLLKQRLPIKDLYQEFYKALNKCCMHEEIRYMHQKGLLLTSSDLQLPTQREQTLNGTVGDYHAAMETKSLLSWPSNGNHGNIHGQGAYGGLQPAATLLVVNGSNPNLVVNGNSGYMVANRNNAYMAANGNNVYQVANGNTTRSVAVQNSSCNGELSQNFVSTFSEVGPQAIEGNETLLHERMPVQENASMDETTPLKVDK